MPSRSFSHTFDTSGTFSYFSPLQPWMTGIITVNPTEMHDDNVDPTLSAESKNNVIVSESTCGPGTKIIDGKCIPESINASGGGCLIATATYGTELAPQVQMLREIRDNQLLSADSGKFFVDSFNGIYYSFHYTLLMLNEDHQYLKK